MKKFFLFLLPVLILFGGYAGHKYLVKTKPKNEPIKIEEQAWVVTVVTVMPMTLSPTLTLYGRVESPRTATLRTPSQSINASEVLEVTVLEGEKVKKGHKLVRLEDNDNLLNLKQREADIIDIKAQIELEKQRHTNNLTALTHEEALLELTQTSLKRLYKLKTQKVSSQSVFEEAQQAVERQMLTLTNRRLEIKNHQYVEQQLQAKLNRALAQRDLTRLELARTQIKAPFTGIVAKVAIAVGDRVRSGDTLLSMYDNTALEVRAQIPSRYQGAILDDLTAGHKLFAQAQINRRPVNLQLDRVSGQINQDSGGIDGLFRVKKGANFLRLGQFITLFLSLPPQARVVALPFEAVYGTNRIYKLVEGRMKGLVIERVGEQITPAGESKILVRSPDLQAGDQVIITQLPNAMDNLKVKVGLSKEK